SSRLKRKPLLPGLLFDRDKILFLIAIAELEKLVQRPIESFSDFLIRFKAKLSLLDYKALKHFTTSKEILER
ncbi:hypothetical protein L249_6012, partial [Ophiocordyceps polyrhachis-furcata BCC 54312]